MNYLRKKDFLVCIDSDGCAMDSMSVKHIQCFGPIMVEEWGLQEYRKEAIKIWNDVNLYTSTRAINRFKGLDFSLHQISEKYIRIDELDVLHNWCNISQKLSNSSLEKEIEKTPALILKKTLDWSNKVNTKVSMLFSQIAPFEGVRDVLEIISPHADIAVVSSADPKAVEHEWRAHDLLKYVNVLLCQDAGDKEYCIKELISKGYDNKHVLMVGDALGDKKAADKNGIHFYPINVNFETESWMELGNRGFKCFLEQDYESYGYEQYKFFLKNLAVEDK